MKLNEYIFKRITNMFDPDTMSDYFTEDDVEKWIVKWYKTTFKNDALPPQWLADWRKRK
tara:strand:+ start:9159 stop:9335 length:177 start_codon:yes stop_codon:yes gene_type:complete